MSETADERTDVSGCTWYTTYTSLGLCYVTVGMFAQRGLGSLSKYTEWSVLGSVLSTNSKEDLDSF